MVDIPTGKLTEVPAGQAGAVPSAMTFKPITEKDEKDHTTFQARLVAANEDLMSASTEAERVAAQEAFDRINAAHQKFKQEAEKFDKVIDDWEEFWQRPENKHHCNSLTHSPTREYLDDYDIDPTYINGTYEITIIKLQEWYDDEVEKVEKLEQENEELQNKILLLESSDDEE